MAREQDSIITDQEKLAQLRRDLVDFIQKVESAFPIDEGGKPDYTGHRATHRDQANKDRDLKLAKISILKNIVTWAFIGALTVIGSTLAQAYIVPVLRLP